MPVAFSHVAELSVKLSSSGENEQEKVLSQLSGYAKLSKSGDSQAQRAVI